MHIVAQAAVIVCAFLGGSTAVVAKPLVADIPPLLLVSIRFFVAALLVAAIMPRRVFPISREVLRAGAVSGTGFGIGCSLLYLSLQHMQPGRLLFIAGLEAVLVPIICGIVYRVKVAAVEKVAVVLAVAGLWFLVGDLTHIITVWDIVAISSALAYSVYTISLSHVSPGCNLASRSFVSFLTIAAMAFCASLVIEDRPTIAFRWSLFWGLFYLVVLGSVGRFVLQGWAQRRVSATFTALAFTSEPVFCLALSFLVLGEVLTPGQSFGAGLILTGLVAAHWPRSSV